MSVLGFLIRRILGKRWVILQGYLDENGEVLEWEPMGNLYAFRRGGAIRRAKAEWSHIPLSIRGGRPLRAVLWKEASTEERDAAEVEDNAGLRMIHDRLTR